MSKEYRDILFATRPTSNYPKMSNDARAAQFAPFSAVSGHHESVVEVARITDEKITMSEDDKNQINQSLVYLNEHKDHCATFVVFQEDDKKTGGKAIEIQGNIKKIDDIYQVIILKDQRLIELKDLIDIIL